MKEHVLSCCIAVLLIIGLAGCGTPDSIKGKILERLVDAEIDLVSCLSEIKSFKNRKAKNVTGKTYLKLLDEKVEAWESAPKIVYVYVESFIESEDKSYAHREDDRNNRELLVKFIAGLKLMTESCVRHKEILLSNTEVNI